MDPEPDLPEENPTQPDNGKPLPIPVPQSQAQTSETIPARIQVVRNNRNQRLVLICHFQTRFTEKEKERCALLVHRILRAFGEHETDVSALMDHQVRQEYANLFQQFQPQPRFSNS